MERKLLSLIAALATVGTLISGYSFLHNKAFVSGAFCNISTSFSCDIVNRGPYSELFGIPVALIGIIGYAFIVATALMLIKRPTDRSLGTFLVLAAAGGFAFSLYLTGIEAFVLKAWCVMCLTSQALIVAILGMSIYLRFFKPSDGHHT